MARAKKQQAAEPGRLEVEYMAIDGLLPYARNSRTHSPEQVAQIAASIREFGFTNPILIDDQGTIIAGHGRLMAARLLELAEVPTICLSHLTESQRRAYVIADNRLALNAGWDMELLAAEVREIENAIEQGLVDFDLSILGFPEAEIADLIQALDGDSTNEAPGEGGAGSLADRFGIAPFSVLNAREGWWQGRKRAWLGLGIRSELGRGENLIPNGGGATSKARYDAQGPAKAYKTQGNAAGDQTGTSVFDPVLCELAYRWFCPDGGAVFDPFAGGSVRGVVAARLGLEYTGIDLRPEQAAANEHQWAMLADFDAPAPRWLVGDSRQTSQVLGDDGYQADFLFTCPPYADLERYSDDPADLSNMPYGEFLEAYRAILAQAVQQLRPDRFAAIVVGEIRDKQGIYRNFVGDTVAAATDAGLAFYNEAILVTAVGSLPIRVGKQFVTSRKLGKTHQNVLVFVKGDPRKAVAALGQPEFADLGEDEQAGGDQ